MLDFLGSFFDDAVASLGDSLMDQAKDYFSLDSFGKSGPQGNPAEQMNASLFNQLQSSSMNAAPAMISPAAAGIAFDPATNRYKPDAESMASSLGGVFQPVENAIKKGMSDALSKIGLQTDAGSGNGGIAKRNTSGAGQKDFLGELTDSVIGSQNSVRSNIGSLLQSFLR